MVGGQFEVAGLPLIRVVELVRRNVLETVHDHPQVMVENLVRELIKREKKMCNKQPCPGKNALQRIPCILDSLIYFLFLTTFGRY